MPLDGVTTRASSRSSAPFEVGAATRSATPGPDAGTFSDAGRDLFASGAAVGRGSARVELSGELASGAVAPVTVIDPTAAHGPDALVLMHWSLENFFDTVDEPEKNDSLYSCSAKVPYCEEAVAQRIQNMASLIREVNGGQGPDIFTFTETENQALADRLRTEGLGELGYHPAVVLEDKDARGIDVGVISRYPIEGTPTLHPVVVEDGAVVRGILEVNVRFKDRVVTVFTSHWPAQLSGPIDAKAVRRAERYTARRLAVAQTMKALFDAKLAQNPSAEIYSVGDFNEDVDGPSLGEHGLAVARTPEEARAERRIYDAAYGLLELIESGAPGTESMPKGSHYYHPEDAWNLLDHVLLSPALLEDEGLVWRPGATVLFAPEPLLGEDGAPRRFFRRGEEPGADGSLDLGGYSDHVPVVTVFEYQDGS